MNTTCGVQQHNERGRPVKFVINTTDGSALKIEDFPPSGVMDILEQWDDHPILTIALDDGLAYFPKANIVRMDTRNND